MKKLRLLLVRHGETKANKKNILQGHKNYHLNKTGKIQSKQLSKRLKNTKIHSIYSSDLTRAKQTAKIIKGKKADIIYDKLLRERHLGDYGGKKISDFVNAAEKKGKNAVNFRPKKGENYDDLKSRANTFFSKIVKSHKAGETILIVTHGGIIQAIIEIISDIKGSPKKKVNIENTSLTTIEYSKNNISIKKICCTKHLKKMKSNRVKKNKCHSKKEEYF